jgi:hypothetical protein
VYDLTNGVSEAHVHGYCVAAQEELRLATLRVINVPALRTTVAVSVVYRRDGDLSAAARSLLSIIERASR